MTAKAKQPKLQVRTAGPPVPPAPPAAPAAPPAPPKRKTPKRKTTKSPEAVEPQPQKAQPIPEPDPELESHPVLAIEPEKNDPEQQKGADSLVQWWYEESD